MDVDRHPQQHHVSDLLRQRTGQGINFFDFTPIAATVFVGCATYFFLVGRRFLPKAEVQSLEQELGNEYLTEVMVTPQSATVGLTLDQLDWAKRQDVTIAWLLTTFVTPLVWRFSFGANVELTTPVLQRPPSFRSRMRSVHAWLFVPWERIRWTSPASIAKSKPARQGRLTSRNDFAKHVRATKNSPALL
jgi:hypothetical protein